MTYCFAFHFGNSVFLYADSVVTGSERERAAGTTSFGQILAPSPGESFGESGTKISRITDRCVAAIAGDMRRAYDAVEVLASALSSKADLQSAIKSLELGLGVEREPSFQLLIASCENTELGLWHFDSANAELRECGKEGLWTIGLPVDSIDAHVTAAADALRKSALSDDTMLTLMAGAYQSAVLQAVTVAGGCGVGGLVLGVRLDRESIHWLPDTNFVVYGLTVGPVDLVQVRHREGGFAVSSPSLPNMHMCVWNRDALAWRDQWAKTLLESIFFRRAANWVFVSYMGFGGVLVFDESPFDVCHLFDARLNTQGTSHIAISEVFETLLLEVVHGAHAPQFVYARPSNCLAVLADALLAYRNMDPSETFSTTPVVKRLEARSYKWKHTPHAAEA